MDRGQKYWNVQVTYISMVSDFITLQTDMVFFCGFQKIWQHSDRHVPNLCTFYETEKLRPVKIQMTHLPKIKWQGLGNYFYTAVYHYLLFLVNLQGNVFEKGEIQWHKLGICTIFSQRYQTWFVLMVDS